jgi:hypothetical protein
MKKLFLLATVWSVFLGFAGNGLAEPYKSKEFPPNNVLSDYFKIKNFTVIGKTKISEDSYKVYFKIKTGPELYTGSPILCCGTIRKLDTDIWIGDQVTIGTNAEILQK